MTFPSPRQGAGSGTTAAERFIESGDVTDLVLAGVPTARVGGARVSLEGGGRCSVHGSGTCDHVDALALAAKSVEVDERGARLGLLLDRSRKNTPIYPVIESAGSWTMVKVSWPAIAAEQVRGDREQVQALARMFKRYAGPGATSLTLVDLNDIAYGQLQFLVSLGVTLFVDDLDSELTLGDPIGAKVTVRGRAEVSVEVKADGGRAIPGTIPTLAITGFPARLVPVAPGQPRLHRMMAEGASRTVPVTERIAFEQHILPELASKARVLTEDFEPITGEVESWLLDVNEVEGHYRVHLVATYGYVSVPPTDFADSEAERALSSVWRSLSLPGRLVDAPLVSPAHLDTIAGPFTEAAAGLGYKINIVMRGETGRLPLLGGATPRLEAATHGDWLDLDVSVEVGGGQVRVRDLYRALLDGHRFAHTDDGLVLLGTEFDELRVLLRQAELLGSREGELRIPTYAAGLVSLPDTLAPKLPDPPPMIPVPGGFGLRLRPYQLDGYRWLAHLAYEGRGGILADEMGLGKTVQVLAMISRGKQNGWITGPVLVVAPSSVVSTWEREARTHTDLTVDVVRATGKRRDWSVADSTADIIVTSYTLVRLEPEEYRRQWSGVVIDEAQTVKNPGTATYAEVAALDRGWTFALSGTPIENKITDMTALLGLTAPDAISPRFGPVLERAQAGDTTARAMLARLMSPFVLRRRKTDVARELPEKIDTLVRLDMTGEHERLYRDQLDIERSAALGTTNRVSILASLTRLRRLAIDPGLDHEAGIPSAKTEFLVDTLGELLPDHRVLVFSQFTSYLARIADRLEAEGISYSYLDGSTRNRDRAIDEFRSGAASVLLISLKAGGVGLTLTEADYVFLMDPWWNPAVEEQAIDRTHRIGQHKPVHIYRLVTAGTVEEKVVDLQAHKRDLATVIDGDVGVIGADDYAVLFEDPSTGLRR